ncbi:ThiF family adenylyltransferase [Amycolatopsis sp. FBCC-B4732]|uniref:HesA/MoeB/ThiF family protein n=1 Tax=Amycolatopsis sp. FBCC-B4732 TaxID=3079339 RepID=UPI001FF5CD52|nr:ThiF family adenylyltransferase [Amycolatopsis sp. FBCC-B4732]UOX92371.1 ThiF family adenylyltransferase [Amycolatopsis sp. FBCC-B4732]
MRRPMIKPEHLPVRHGGNRVRIGGVVRGIAADIADPDGWVWALLELLDGSRTTGQVVADLARLHPTRAGTDVRAAIDDLIRAGYVEDAGEPAPGRLTAAERERYGRSKALFRWMDRAPRRTSWDTQLLLSGARVVVIGIGGVGCTAAQALVRSGVGHVHCVEPDVVELSNLNRQVLFTERDLGRPKVDVAVDRLREQNSEVRVTGTRLAVDGPAVLRTLATGFDVVLLAADQPEEIRSWTNQACEATGTAWVHGGYHGPQVGCGLYRPGAGPCYDCARVAERERRAGLPPRTYSAASGRAARTHAANAVSAGVAGQLAAHATLSLITGAPALRTNCQYGFNLVTLQDSFAIGPDAPRPDCPTCA